MDKPMENLLSTVDFSVNSSSATYYNSEGQRVPRVTEVLSKMIHSDGLMYWANSLGFKGLKYSTELNRAANIGTAAHNAIEDYLLRKISDMNNIPFQGFLMWYTNLTEVLGLSVNIIYIEHKMACKWFGGTLDCLIEIDGKIYLMDFKTSNHITFKYFLQLAAYRYMLKVEEGINVDGVIVLQLDKSQPGFNEYTLNFGFPDHLDFIDRCENTFLALVYAYYCVYDIEKGYKAIF